MKEGYLAQLQQYQQQQQQQQQQQEPAAAVAPPPPPPPLIENAPQLGSASDGLSPFMLQQQQQQLGRSGSDVICPAPADAEAAAASGKQLLQELKSVPSPELEQKIRDPAVTPNRKALLKYALDSKHLDEQQQQQQWQQTAKKCLEPELKLPGLRQSQSLPKQPSQQQQQQGQRGLHSSVSLPKQQHKQQQQQQQQDGLHPPGGLQRYNSAPPSAAAAAGIAAAAAAAGAGSNVEPPWPSFVGPLHSLSRRDSSQPGPQKGVHPQQQRQQQQGVRPGEECRLCVEYPDTLVGAQRVGRGGGNALSAICPALSAEYICCMHCQQKKMKRGHVVSAECEPDTMLLLCECVSE
jgi:hypothetical protein